MLRMYYFSGTGNARNVAHWMAAAWRERGRDAAVVDIARARPEDLRVGPADEVDLASAYRLLHRGLRFRVVERLTTWTSQTRFACWRRYRAPRPRTALP